MNTNINDELPPRSTATVWMLIEVWPLDDPRSNGSHARVDALFTHKPQAEAALRAAKDAYQTHWYLREMSTQPHGEGQPEFGERA